MKNLILSFVLISTLFAGSKIKAPEGPLRGVTKADYNSHKLRNENYSEAWNYSFYLDNGTWASVTYSQNNLPMKGEVFGGELAFTGFKGKNPSVSRQYPVGRFAWKEEIKGLELTSGEHTRMAVEGMPGVGHRVHYQTDKGPGYLLDLTFKSAAKGKVRGDGVFKLEKAFFGQVICIPQGRVEGIIAVGKDTLKVTGYGVMEKTWQSRLLDELTAHVVQVYKPGAFAGKVLLTEENFGEGVMGYSMVKEGGQWVPKYYDVFKTGDKNIGADSGTPRVITLEAEGSVQKFTRKKDRVVYSPLDNVEGWFQKKAIKMAMGEIKVRRGESEGIFYNVLEK